MDVQKDQEFISHCGPGEWVVCNCITEGDDYVRLNQVENNLDFEDSVNRDAKAARNAVDRLVTTAISARSNVLKVLNQFEQKG